MKSLIHMQALVLLTLGSLAACGGEGGTVPSPAASSSTNADTDPYAAWVRVPGGVLAHPSCVHALPDGAILGKDRSVYKDRKLVEAGAPCAYPTYDPKSVSASASAPKGRIQPMGAPHIISGIPTELEYAYANTPASNYIVTFGWGPTPSDGLVVPPAPTTNDGQVLFLTSHIDDGWLQVYMGISWGSLEQDYLNNDSVIGGPYWQAGAWYVVDDNEPSQPGSYSSFWYGSSVKVSPGDLVTAFGELEPLGPNGSGGLEWDPTGVPNAGGVALTTSAWTSTGTLIGQASNTAYPASNFTKMVAAEIATYGVLACSDLPAVSDEEGYSLFPSPYFTYSASQATGTVDLLGSEVPTWWADAMLSGVKFDGPWVASAPANSTPWGSACPTEVFLTNGSTGVSLTY